MVSMVETDNIGDDWQETSFNRGPLIRGLWTVSAVHAMAEDTAIGISHTLLPG